MVKDVNVVLVQAWALHFLNQLPVSGAYFCSRVCLFFTAYVTFIDPLI